MLTPRFHPTKDEIAFMSYANNRPRVYLVVDLTSGHQSVLGDWANMTLSPRFSPDGSNVVMSVTDGGGADIVAVDLASRASHRLTSGGTSRRRPMLQPRRLADRVQLLDRGGDQQLYVMGAGGGNDKQINYGKGRYATPVWSPRGRVIAFTKLGGDTDNFAIGVMHPDGSGERLLSAAWDVEGPDLLPERPSDHVLARRTWRRLAPGVDRHHRLQRAGGADADRRLRPGLVAARRLTSCATVGGDFRQSGQAVSECDCSCHREAYVHVMDQANTLFCIPRTRT